MNLDRVKLRALSRIARWRHQVLGHLDAPTSPHVYCRFVDLAGWAFARDGSAVSIRVTADERTVAETAAELPRPDVGRQHPTSRGAAQSGFRLRVPRAQLPGDGSGVIAVSAQAATSNGWRGRLVLGRIRLLQRQQLQGARVRSDYRGTWDAVADSASAARLAVAGYVDDDEWDRTGRSTADTVAEATALQPSEQVLEIGCGTGRVGAWLAPRCVRWIGADVSPRMLEHARQQLGHLPNVGFRALNGYDLEGIEDASADVVYCTAVFMHLDEWERYRYVCEAFRVLRPGGRVYYDNYNLLSDEGWKVFLELAEIDPPWRPPNISKSSTPQELEAYARRAGFADIRVYPSSLWITVVARKPAGGAGGSVGC